MEIDKLKPDIVNPRKVLSVWNGVFVVIGTMVGSGIFISPKGIAEFSGSVGFSLVIWVLSGIVSILGAQAYIELGTMLSECGGDYQYIQYTFGSFMGFMYAWIMIVMVIPASNAIAAITFANYLLQPVFPCAIPTAPMLILATLSILVLTFVNCWSVPLTARINDLLGITKVAILIMIVGMGVYAMALGNVENFSNSFENTRLSTNSLIQALYNGLYCYLGYNYLNFMAGEMRDVKRDLPRAILIGMISVVVIFVLVNIAYFSLLSPAQMATSNAVAVTFATKLHPSLGIVISVAVGLSTFGFLNGSLMTTSRITYAAAGNGHMPHFFGLVSRTFFTPITSLIVVAVLSVCAILFTDVYFLINVASFAEYLMITFSEIALIVLRIKEPNRHRPAKTYLIFPIVFLIFCAFILIVSVITLPNEMQVSGIIIGTGILCYFVVRHIPSFAEFLERPHRWITVFSQKITNSVFSETITVQNELVVEKQA